MSHSLPTAAAFGLTLLAATFAPLPAHAQSAEPRVVTRDELRVCMDSEDSLKARRADLEARAKQNSDDAAAINKEGDELKEEQKRVEDSGQPMLRDLFDRRVRQYQARLKAGREKEAALRTAMEDLQKAIDQHNARCHVAFNPDDKEAIMKERAAKGK